VPPMPPARTDAYLAPARHLGEAVIARLWARGQALSSEAAVALAIGAQPSKAASMPGRVLPPAGDSQPRRLRFHESSCSPGPA
jgi:hypothetical protein